jgi:hypothetical protein
MEVRDQLYTLNALTLGKEFPVLINWGVRRVPE